MNEIFKWAKKTNNKNFLLKVDFNKAFNSLNWDNLDKIMNQMGLVSKGETRFMVAYHLQGLQY